MRWDLTLVGWIHSLINNLSHLPGWDDFSHIISCLHALLLKMIKDILACLIFLRSSQAELHGKRLSFRNMLKSVSKWIHSSNRTRLRKMISTTEKPANSAAMFSRHFQKHKRSRMQNGFCEAVFLMRNICLKTLVFLISQMSACLYKFFKRRSKLH